MIMCLSIYLCPSMGPDQTSSGWSLQVELQVEVVAEVTRGQLTLSLPGLDTQQTFPVQFLPGRTRNTYTLHVNTVRQSEHRGNTLHINTGVLWVCCVVP